ncbi:MAG: hypothetical protein IT569_07370 [Leptospiraceae bacterium]|nr:hypothetical protein [Leptospiraceae bacterium]
MKVSFDFDETLSRPDVQEFARELLNDGFDVWVVTMRFVSREEMVKYHNDEKKEWEGNEDLFLVTRNLGIPDEKVVFTNYQWKSEFLKGKGFVWHLDDCADILTNIREECMEITPINSWNNSIWKNQCLTALRPFSRELQN